MPTTTMVIGILVLLAVVVALSSIRIAKEYERGVVFRLGRLIDLKGPGLFLWQCLDPRPAVVAEKPEDAGVDLLGQRNGWRNEATSRRSSAGWW
ncbi:MAG: hypothetical protein M3256_19990 [Actinomycetota bacterium]|nr:hypothetical protein [Actinomycetota bacterium]